MALPPLRLANGRFASIQQIINSLQNPTPLLERIGKFLQQSTRDRIKTTKTAPSGKAWAGWSFATEMARERKGTAGRGLLFDSGALYNSIQYQVQAKQVILGAGVAYANYLQNGTPHMPARPFIGFSQSDVKSIDLMVRDFIQKR